MYITKKRYEQDLNYLRGDLEVLAEKYRELAEKHEGLLEYLDLIEVERPARRIIEKKERIGLAKEFKRYQ